MCFGYLFSFYVFKAIANVQETQMLPMSKTASAKNIVIFTFHADFY